jgi:hypothetical protein
VTITKALRRRRTTVLLAAVLVAMPVTLGACGDGAGGEQDAEALLNRAFSQEIPSADVELDAQLEVEGLQGFEDPIQIRAAGPYIRSEQRLPKLDVDLNIGTAGAGQSVQSGLLSTGDRVFLKFGGSYFEQPREQVAAANRRLARNGDGGGGSLADLGLDPRSWIVDAAVRGEEEIDGVPTEHIEGTLDIAAVVTDLNELVKRSAGALGSADDRPQPLGKDDIQRLSRSVENPTFDVYVGKDDDVIRRISLKIDMTVPEDDRQDVEGITGASVQLSVELGDIGGDQKVEAPASSRPIADLTRQLGGLSALAGATGLGGGTDTPSAAPDATDGGSSSGGDDGGGTDADAFEQYGQCLEQARPDDAQAIERCSQLVAP